MSSPKDLSKTTTQLPENSEILPMYVTALKGNFGFVSPDKGSRKGHFFHASQLCQLSFKDLVIGQPVDVLGAVTGQPPKTSIQGVIYKANMGAAVLKEREFLKKSADFSAEHVRRFSFRPTRQVTEVYLTGGWDAVTMFYATEKAAEEARQPPPREPFSKAPVPQSFTSDKPRAKQPPHGAFIGNKPV